MSAASWVVEKLSCFLVRKTVIVFTITCSDWVTALLGEADFLTGQVLCPKTPPDALASFAGVVPPPDEWVVDGVCAYVPQVSLGFFFSDSVKFALFRAHGYAMLRSKVRSQYWPLHVNAERPLHRQYPVQSSLCGGTLPEDPRGLRSS